MRTETIETLAGVGQKTYLAGGSVSALSLWMANNALGIAGVLITLIGVLINSHYKRKASKRHDAKALEDRVRADAEAAVRMEAIKLDNVRREDAHRQRSEIRALQMEVMRKTGTHIDIEPSDMAPLEMPLAPQPAPAEVTEDDEEEDGR